MGWGRFLLMGPMSHEFDLIEQKKEIERLKAEFTSLREGIGRDRFSARDVSTEIWQLRNENDELKLYVAALVRILVAKNIVDREEMRYVVNAIDAEDGTPDGKYEGKIV